MLDTDYSMMKHGLVYFSFLLDVEDIDFFDLALLLVIREGNDTRKVGVLTKRKKKTSLFALRAA